MSWNVALPCRMFFQKCCSLKSLNLVDRELSNSEAPHLLLQTFLLTLSVFSLQINWNQKLLVTSSLEVEKFQARDFKSVVFMSFSSRFSRFAFVNPWAEKDRQSLKADWKDILIPSSWQTSNAVEQFCSFDLATKILRLFDGRLLSHFFHCSIDQISGSCATTLWCKTCREDDGDGRCCCAWKTLPQYIKTFIFAFAHARLSSTFCPWLSALSRYVCVSEFPCFSMVLPARFPSTSWRVHKIKLRSSATWKPLSLKLT